MLAFNHLVPQVAALFAEFDWNSLYLPLIWFSVILLSLIVESQTADLVSIWFAPGAFVAMILAFCDVHVIIQLAVFAGLTVIGLILAFTVVRPAMKRRNTVLKTNADAMAEKTALVEEDIDNANSSGAVKVNGQLWTARMEDPTLTAAKGDWVVIVRVEGAKVICRPAP